MPLPFMTAAIALSELVPSISKWMSSFQDSPDSMEKMAQKVVVLAKTLTKKEDAMEAVQILSQDPKLLNEYQKALLSFEIDLEKAYLEERWNARTRDAALIVTGRSNTRADIMVVAAALGLLFCLIALGYYQDALPGEAVGIISTIAGIFGSCLKDAYAFEFGSSRGSKTKDLASLFRRTENGSF